MPDRTGNRTRSTLTVEEWYNLILPYAQPNHAVAMVNLLPMNFQFATEWYMLPNRQMDYFRSPFGSSQSAMQRKPFPYKLGDAAAAKRPSEFDVWQKLQQAVGQCQAADRTATPNIWSEVQPEPQQHTAAKQP